MYIGGGITLFLFKVFYRPTFIRVAPLGHAAAPSGHPHCSNRFSDTPVTSNRCAAAPPPRAPNGWASDAKGSF